MIYVNALFNRYGVWGDWDTPYATLQPVYEAAQIKVFGQMVAKGHIYRGKKPVHWSPSSRLDIFISIIIMSLEFDVFCS
jgi:isoleucyl-tRNA synthetase